MEPGPNSLDPARQLRLRSTLRRALSCWWDHLGVCCAVSILAIVSVMAALAISERLGLYGVRRAPVKPVLALVLVAATAVYAGSGLYRIADAMVHRDDGSLRLFLGPRPRDLAQAYGLAAVQILVTAALLANVWFYLAWRTQIGIALAVLFGYILAIWLLNCGYHWPLLIAAQHGRIPTDEGKLPSLRGVFRNGLVLLLTAPAYTAALAGVTTVILLILAATGIGMVLIVPALSAVFGAQAVHDHMVRMGMLPPPPEGQDVPDEPWHLPQE